MKLMNAERIWLSFMLRLVLCKWGAHRCGEGRERKDCMPATVGVPPVSSGTEDPFNLSTMPWKKHASPKGLCHPSAKKKKKKKKHTTFWICFWNGQFNIHHLVFKPVLPSVSFSTLTWHKAGRLPRNTCLQIRCRFKSTRSPFFSYQWQQEKGKTHITESRAASVATAFQEHKRGTLKRSCTQWSTFVPYTYTLSHTHTHS